MYHGRKSEPREQEDQRVTEAQRVVDRAQQHHCEDDREQVAGACRQDENAPLAENDGQRFVALSRKIHCCSRNVSRLACIRAAESVS